MPDMPKFTKSSSQIVERFGAVMDRYPHVQRRQMFGYPAAFVGGNMATGLFAEHWVVRLSDDELATAIAGGAAPFEVIPGRPPNLLNPPVGCKFAPRCKYVRGKCLEEEPPLFEAATPGHQYRCWFPVGTVEPTIDVEQNGHLNAGDPIPVTVEAD